MFPVLLSPRAASPAAATGTVTVHAQDGTAAALVGYTVTCGAQSGPTNASGNVTFASVPTSVTGVTITDPGAPTYTWSVAGGGSGSGKTATVVVTAGGSQAVTFANNNAG